MSEEIYQKNDLGEKLEECSVDPLADKFRAFNFKTIEIEFLVDTFVDIIMTPSIEPLQ